MIQTLAPKAPPSMFRTYSVIAPVSSHFRLATCEEVNCPLFLNGWRVPATGKRITEGQADYIRNRMGLRYTEVIEDDGPVFYFEAGQQCPMSNSDHPKRHRKRLSRPELYIARSGDFRRYIGKPRQFPTSDDWLEEFNRNQEQLIRKG